MNFDRVYLFTRNEMVDRDIYDRKNFHIRFHSKLMCFAMLMGYQMHFTLHEYDWSVR